jgi:acetolactate synthase regulatory subunit
MYINNMKNKNKKDERITRLLKLLKSRGGRVTDVHSTDKSYNRHRDKIHLKKIILE